MPYKDIEKRKEYMKKYREDNKDVIKVKSIGYQKKYKQTEKGKKSIRISNWKKRGIKSDDFDELYEKYINSEYCELCNVKLTTDKKRTKTTRCLDHCHQTGKFRNIVCHSCNVKLR